MLRAGVVAAVRAGEVAGIDVAVLLTPGAEPRSTSPDDADRLVVVDQFEELFTLCDDADRRQRVHRRAAAAALRRRDRRCAPTSTAGSARHAELARAVAGNQVLLGAMTDDELERAVTEPARLAGLRLEPGLVELILRDVAAEPGALPLLSHALRATWERRDGRTLTVDGYRESGGVASAIARTADAVVDALPAEQRPLARSVFLRHDRARRGQRGLAAARRRSTSSSPRARLARRPSARCSSGSPTRGSSRSTTAPPRSPTRR